MPQLIEKDDRSRRRSLKEFLYLRSRAQRRTEFPTDCGSLCAYLPAQFWLDGDEEVFSISLPFCPHCNPEILSRVPAVA
jgi:hypothetical protein